MPYTKPQLLDAINHTIAERDPRYLREALDAVGQLRARYPVKLAGELAVLNPLLALKDTDPEAFARVQQLIDTKRAEAAMPPAGRPKARRRLTRSPTSAA